MKLSKGINLSISEIILENYKGFNNQTIPLFNNVTLLISENGLGKTSILDGIAECLKLFIWQLFKEKYTVPPEYRAKDIKNGAKVSKLQMNLDFIYSFIEEEQHDDNSENQKADDLDQFKSKYSIRISRNTKKQSFFIGDYTLTNEDSTDFHDLFNRTWQENESLPIFMYLGGNKLKDDTLKYSKVNDLKFHLYNECLEPQRGDLSEFIVWFDTEFKKTLIKKESTLHLKIINEVIIDFLKDESENGQEYQVLSMDYDYFIDDTLVINKMEENLSNNLIQLSQLSSGEKIIISLITSIAKKLLLANPLLENPLEGYGIILIDEIDLHLHPKWQRKILPYLCEKFKNLQFIVTTHSPFVVQSISRKNCILLTKDRINIDQEDEASSYEAVVIDYFLGLDFRFDIHTAKLLKEFRKISNEIKIGKKDKKDPEFKEYIKLLANKGDEIKRIIAFELRQI